MIVYGLASSNGWNFRTEKQITCIVGTHDKCIHPLLHLSSSVVSHPCTMAPIWSFIWHWTNIQSQCIQTILKIQQVHWSLEPYTEESQSLYIGRLTFDHLKVGSITRCSPALKIIQSNLAVCFSSLVVLDCPNLLIGLKHRRPVAATTDRWRMVSEANIMPLMINLKSTVLRNEDWLKKVKSRHLVLFVTILKDWEYYGM